MAKIKNEKYLKFIKEGYIELVTIDQIKQACERMKPIRKQQSKSLLITMFWTGARPTEILRLRGKDITRKNNYLVINMTGAKHGLPRPIKLPLKLYGVRTLYDYSKTIFDDVYLFWYYRNSYKRTRINKKGNVVEYKQDSDKLRYHFNKWFQDMETPINPYYLRHNRFSDLIMRGASFQEIKIMKGSRSMDSVTPYIHMSQQIMDKISRQLLKSNK